VTRLPPIADELSSALGVYTERLLDRVVRWAG
jgi:hypothetical protein